MLEFLDPSMMPEYLREVAAIDDVLNKTKGGRTPEILAEAMKGLQFHSMEFLKLQMQFAKTGEYKAKDYDTVYKEVYSAGNVMSRYLDGLLLTYIAWPNHYRLLKWYKEAFLAKAKPGRCLEIGPGHGWLALCQLQSNPANSLLGLDISEHSVKYSTSVLKAVGIADSRHKIIIEDARGGLKPDAGAFDRIVVAEVVEHLAHPDVMLKSCVQHSHQDTLFFITTVVNIEAVDHLYLFRELHEIDTMMADCGLKITDRLDMELKMNLKLDKPAYEVALVCKRK
jgi:2-polyprenyl-3-methyl-5-hydroxy-6-metoxy-1,4-benzoquinol methylase